MFRRIVMALTFVAALGAAGVGLANNAQAQGCGYGGYGGGYAHYNGYRNVYRGGYPTYYPSYYSAGYVYTPPVVFYPGGRGHGYRSHHGHHGHGGF